MAALFEYEKEAIRIKAKMVDKEEYRKFSIDPNITSFEILQSILCRAFEIRSADIGITYRIVDGSGKESWTPLLSDWDLDTAILASTEPGLFLNVKVLDVTTGTSLGELSRADSLTSPVLEVGQSLVKELEPVQKSLTDAAATARAVGTSQVSVAGASLQGLMTRSGQRVTEIAKSGQASGFFKRHVEQTLPGLARQVRSALSMGQDDERSSEASRPPVSDREFRSFLNKVGQMVAPREFRLAVYRGGLEPGIRKAAWKHLLNLYPAGLTGGERMSYLAEKSQMYKELKKDWMDLVLQGRITDDVKTIMNMVRKDVLRTDRQEPFFAGEGNPNVTTLFNILTTYALNHPSDSYCQGMSDLAAPLLVTMADESHTYLCFCALMSRLTPNFLLDGTAMTCKFQHLSEGLMYYDPEFFTYLKMHQADDLLFCYRWLLLEMKREFVFDHALKALEVTWSSLPPATADTEVRLWETRFSPKLAPRTTDLSKPCETAYGKVVSLRRMSLERRNTSSSGPLVDGARGRIRSEQEPVREKNTFRKSRSVANDILKRKRFNSPSPKDDNIGEVTEVGGGVGDTKFGGGDVTRSGGGGGEVTRSGGGDTKRSPSKTSSSRSSPSKTVVAPPGKKLVNLKEFYSLTTATSPVEETKQPGGDTKENNNHIAARLEEDSAGKTATAATKDEEEEVAADSSVAETPAKEEKGEAVADVTSPCEEATASCDDSPHDDPFDWVGYSQANAALTVYCNRLPPPTVFGHGNPFLMFLCLSCLLQHRDHIMARSLDYQDIAMYFDKMVRGHNVDKVLAQARKMFAEYLNEDWTPSPQPTTPMQAHNC